MVRTAPKRKSENALLPAKQRETGSFSNSPSPEPEYHSSDDSSVKDAPVAARHVKKRVRPSERADDEYGEDVGRTESQTFLALVEFESNKKRKAHRENRGFMERFERDVRGREGDLKTLLEEGESTSSKRDAQFLETFKAAYAVSRNQVSVPQPAQNLGAASTPADGFAAMYLKSKEITTAAFALISQFEEVAQCVEQLDTTAMLENNWGEQDETFSRLLRDGKRLGVKKYRRILTASKEQALEQDDEADVFFDEDDSVKGVWGLLAKKQEKAFKKLVNTVEMVGERA